MEPALRNIAAREIRVDLRKVESSADGGNFDESCGRAARSDFSSAHVDHMTIDDVSVDGSTVDPIKVGRS